MGKTLAQDISPSVLADLRKQASAGKTMFGGAKEKYAGTGRALPFLGCSVIAMAPDDFLPKPGLQQLVQDYLVAPLTAAGIRDEAAWNDPGSYHMTTNGLANVRHQSLFPDWGPAKAVDVCGAAQEVVDLHMTRAGKGRLTGQITGVRTSGGRHVTLVLELDERSNEVATAFRKELARHMCERVPGFDKILGGKVGRLSPHISIAYMLGVVPPAAEEAYLQALTAADEFFRGMRVEFSLGSAMVFTDMDHFWSPSAYQSLQGPGSPASPPEDAGPAGSEGAEAEREGPPPAAAGAVDPGAPSSQPGKPKAKRKSRLQ